MEEVFKDGSIVRHFKRDADNHGSKYLYLFLGTARHTETDEVFAIYRELYGAGRLHARPLKSFYDLVDRNIHPESIQDRRFELATNEEIEYVKNAGLI